MKKPIDFLRGNIQPHYFSHDIIDEEGEYIEFQEAVNAMEKYANEKVKEFLNWHREGFNEYNKMSKSEVIKKFNSLNNR